MFVEMYGIGCAFCGRDVWAWVGDRMWPCACPAPALGAPDDAPPAPPARRLQHTLPNPGTAPRAVPA
ncbi:hypothetical protein GCM10023199_44770 [Actinomycetospora chibensis]